MRSKWVFILLVFCAVSFLPLSSKAEMQVMTDSEMEMVAGQAGIWVSVLDLTQALGSRPLMQNLTGALMPLLSPLLNSKLTTSLLNSKLTTSLLGLAGPLLEADILPLGGLVNILQPKTPINN